MEIPSDDTLHQVLRRSSAQYPHNTALISYWDRNSLALTYSELLSRVAALSTLMLRCGLRPKQLVAIVTDMSGEFCVAALSALESSCAFVYVDPTFPEARMNEMYRSILPAIIVAQSDTLETCKWLLDWHVPIIIVDKRLNCKFIHAAASGSSSEAKPYGEAAYVMFTSGSTTRPLPVEVSSRCASVNLQAIAEQLQVLPGDRCVLASPGSFDPCIVEMFIAWAAGASLHAFPMQVRRSPERLVEVLKLISPTVLQCSPSMLRVIAAGILCDHVEY